MEPSKNWYASLTIWGAIVSGLAAIAAQLGYTISADNQAALATGMRDISTMIVAAGAVVGPILTVIGRVRATKIITADPVAAKAPAFLLAAGLAMCLAPMLGACSAAGMGNIGSAMSAVGAGAVQVGEALYAVECRTDAIGQIGAGVATVAAIQAPNGEAAAKIKAALARNDAIAARACPLATAVEIVVAAR